MIVQNFAELNLSEPIMRAVNGLGYEKPSQVQAESLPILLGEPTDFVGLAATGTGKTAAFAIPLLEKIDPAKRSVQALILCPTRELALQVSGQIDILGKYKGIRSLPIYGGAGYDEQFRGLRSGANVVVGTPGRLVDHIERGSLKLDELQTIVLDEADEMISMGFKEELEAILAVVPIEKCNIWLFSATMSREVRKVADKFLREPQQVQVNRTKMLAEGLEQLFYITQEKNKPEVLCKLIDAADDFFGIVFCQTKTLVMDLTQYLLDRGYKVDCLHGDKTQLAREKTMQAFRDRKVNIMVCTDVAARGLDVKDITHVINYSIPRELDNYVHRIGRTARGGTSTGYAMSLVTNSHRRLIFQIEKMTNSRMIEGRIPSRREVAGKKLLRALPKFQEVATHARALELLDDSWKQALSQMTAEEVAARFLALSYPDIFAGQDMPEMTRSDRAGEQGDRPERRDRPDRGGFRGGRGDRFASRDGGERRERRFDRGESRERYGRKDRPEGSERPERVERPERRADRFERSDRPERTERPERHQERQFERPIRAERPEPRFDRAPAIERTERPAKTARFTFDLDEVGGEPRLNRRARRDMMRAQGLLAEILPSAGAEGGSRSPRRSQPTL